MTTIPLINDKREIRGWMLYDFANSAFSTTVVTTFLGPYLTSVIESQVGDGGSFTLLGIPIAAESFFTYCVSLSVLLQVFVLPILGSIPGLDAEVTPPRGFLGRLRTGSGAGAVALAVFLAHAAGGIGGFLV